MARHYSAEQWAAWVCEQQESELNVVEFCEWIGVSPNSFYRWRQKLGATDRRAAGKERAAQSLSTMKRSMSAGPELVPLTVVTSPVVEIDLPCGAVVRVPNDDRSLRRVLEVLLDAEQATEISPNTTPSFDLPRGDRR